MDEAPSKNSHNPDGIGGGAYRWDDGGIEKELVDIPELARDAYRRLKQFARDQFHRDIGRFAAHACSLGCTIPRYHWGVILKGRGWIDARGVARQTVSVDAFIEAAQTVLRKHAEDEMRGRRPFVWTTAAEDIRNYVEERNALGRTNRWGVVIGETGLGKTATAHQLRRDMRDRFYWIESPENASRPEIVRCMAAAYGYSVTLSPGKLKDSLFRTIKREHIWWFDNAQRLWIDDPQQRTMDLLLRLQEHTRATFILSFTPYDALRLQTSSIASWWEQVEGRSGGGESWLRLPEYPSPDDAVLIARSYGLVDADAHRTELHKLSLRKGRIRILFEVLSKADELVQGEGRPMTMEDVRAVAPSGPVAPGRRAR